MIRILADENLHSGIVRGLREAGYEVTRAQDVGLGAHPDDDIVAYADEHGLVVICGDKGFGGLVEFGRLWGTGRVILLRYRLLRVPQILHDILFVLRSEEALIASKDRFVIVMSEARYRMHEPQG